MGVRVGAGVSVVAGAGVVDGGVIAGADVDTGGGVGVGVAVGAAGACVAGGPVQLAAIATATKRLSTRKGILEALTTAHLHLGEWHSLPRIVVAHLVFCQIIATHDGRKHASL